MADRERVDVVVVGAGIIGLSAAWLARRQGLSVIVLERGEVGWGASHVAAGMLAPVAEADYGQAAAGLLELGLRSAEVWPQYAALLEHDSGIDVGLMRTGTLLLARDEDEARELDRQLALQRSLGLTVERLRGSEARAREPGLAPNVRLALELPDDHSVDPRRVLGALRAACEASGVEIREHAPLERVQLDEGRLAGAVPAGGELVPAASLVLAAGAWSGEIEGLPAGERIPVRPVKGQIMRLRDPAGPGLLQRVLRFQGGYLVPRPDGRYVLGATVEERGLELGATAGGTYELLRDARELLPGVLELEIEELATGLRPGTPDNVPVIGRGSIPGLVWAGGHHRNGILLAPITALLVAHVLELQTPELAALDRAAADGLLASCSPRRFELEGRPAGATPPTQPVGAGR
jgi:glycine oxidase